VLIVETSVFTRRLLKVMSDEDYKELQRALVADPERGPIIRGSGGLRKCVGPALAVVNEVVFARSIIGREVKRLC
jgi:hypothetical protein